MPYDLIPISIPLIIAYIGTYVLYKKHLITKALHIRIWNILILISFLIAAGIGITLIALLEYDITLSLSPKMLFWHVEGGIAMFVISIFHIHFYWNSFKKLIFG